MREDNEAIAIVPFYHASIVPRHGQTAELLNMPAVRFLCLVLVEKSSSATEMCTAVRLVLVLLLASLLSPAALGRELKSYAFVEEDGTLRISGRQVHLYGIHIPPTGRTCRTFIRPVRCGSRASLALDFRIQGFVSCEVVRQHRDRSVTGLCRVGGEDLSAYLLSRGWALALPNAPFEYVALERIARHKSLGVWGMPVDRIGKRR